ncbi:MAG: hypothetical protein HN341_15730 [Verrucomicrobia bacterium]|nr:hypothetical protein [Verrucomicrobiota bacterium]
MQSAMASTPRVSLPSGRGKRDQWVFDTYRDRLSRKYVLLQDPIAPNNRAIAIAHRCLTVYGLEEPSESIFKWMEAYALFAKEIPSLTGMMLIDYAPYEEGDGKVFWFPNADGVDIPVVTAKYTLWANLKQERSGTPKKIARLINEDAAESQTAKTPFHAWTSIHAWSGFQENWGGDEEAENGLYNQGGSQAGVAPTYWCVKRLDPSIRVVTPDELIWRIRMTHRPEQTRAVLELSRTNE